MGGKWDPRSGGRLIEASVPIKDQLTFYRTHPPRIVDGFKISVAELEGFEFDGHGEPVNTCFGIKCGCGAERLKVKGWYYTKNERGEETIRSAERLWARGFDKARKAYLLATGQFGTRAFRPYFGSPLALECLSCGRSQGLFDENRHGWDGEFGHWEDTQAADRMRPQRAEPRTHRCDHCGEEAHEIYVRFEFPSDALGNEEFKGREPELFSWITLVGRCPGNSKLVTVYDCECA